MSYSRDPGPRYWVPPWEAEVAASCDQSQQLVQESMIYPGGLETARMGKVV